MSDRLHTTAVVDPAGVTAVRDVCRRHAHGLYLASFFLPPIKRDAARAVFAFGWLIDQAIDEGSCADDSVQGRLDLFRDRLGEIYQGRLELPQPEFRDQTQHILAAFADAAVRFEIPRQYFVEWAEGFKMDRTVRRYATWTSLQNHCYHSGGVMALVMASVLGTRNSDGGKYAIAIGNAIRFTRILVNVKRDWLRGRIYIPLEDFARFGYSERELAASTVNPAFCELMKVEIARARELYRAGADGICWLSDDGSRAAAAVIAVNSSSVLRKIERTGYDVFRQIPDTGKLERLLHLPAAWRLARRSADQPLPDVF